MSLKKHKSSSPFASTKKATQRENLGKKVSKTFDQNWADVFAASDRRSCFEQEKLLALDEEDALNF